ncbi:hypothetical protein A3D00_03455 [Candidatus Woesebacteria bacterium RIFCSPHIGHO2_02_FULL_38_9]|uniref:YdbS-like PH domain-containing protein n=1 Tax=Candidatus Woesebacteria bacterium RIFCSPHIGHO2_01_FULL_39_28 TaxID=1802496 RepID=A0A1F7YGU8_9BACT|nr:MAG: hypothetical protein A2627_00710 [Candidatus Woesebacteria bacterium RIFCSPHIGHO2_01_FULL_39_28]OGM32555.1 MAG: hypothetical protein A3D00_03455 [Candidatus Woesebacteria bacterium RIFCSPHIGHO2_02_FULL_38_9]OGM58757.1 MAG: hypothetical protein A3A50_03155 [Candidatus Woesebacteria bacterium RIFCSPLOWO2_01_FULL_38_20]
MKKFPPSNRKPFRDVTAFCSKVFTIITIAVLPLVFFAIVFTQMKELNSVILLEFIFKNWFITLIIIFILTFVYYKIFFRKYYYEFKEHSFILKKGVFFPRETVVLYKNVKSIFTKQDFFDKLFKLFQIRILVTEGFRGEDLGVEGLEEKDCSGFIETFLRFTKKENESN